MAERKKKEVVAAYNYRLPDGATIFQVAEYRDGSRAVRCPDERDATRWRWGRARFGVQALPYRLPEILAAQQEGKRTLWIVPTERDADEMAKQGFAATCVVGMAESADGDWKAGWAPWVQGFRQAVVIARNDPAPAKRTARTVLDAYQGQRLAERTRAAITGHPFGRVRCLVLPAVGGDARPLGPAQWFVAGGTAEALAQAVKAAPPWQCPDAMDDCSPEELERFSRELNGNPGSEQPAKFGPAAASDSSGKEISAAGAPPPHAKRDSQSVGGLPDDDPRSVAELRAVFVGLFCDASLDKFKRREAMEAAFVAWLLRRGRLYYHAELRTHSTSLFFDSVEKRLMYLARDYFRSWAALAMRINPESPDYRFVMSRVQAEAMAGKATTGIVPERYWARRSDRVYISCGRGLMVRCSARGAEVVDVGTDNVLFEDGGELEPWDLMDGPGADPFDKCEVFRTMNAIYPRGRVLLKLWAMSLCGHGNSTKPILLLSGRARSGKTRLALAIMELYGLPSKATMISKTYKDTDFWTLADSGGVMCLDNADSYIDWLPGCLATVATCGSYSKRKSYTDNELITQRARCWCAVTGTQPSFASDSGVADRLLTVELYSREAGDTKEMSLRADIMRHRNEGMTWIARAWCAALADEATPPSAVNSRHPDWGLTAFRLARAAGIEEDAVSAMSESEASKSVFALRNDALGEHLIDAFGEEGFSGSATEMFDALKERCAGFDGERTWSVPKVGKALKRLEPHLVQAFSMSRTNYSGCSNYKFCAISQELRTPTMLGVNPVFANSAHVGECARAHVLSPPTSPTSNNFERREEDWDL